MYMCVCVCVCVCVWCVCVCVCVYILMNDAFIYRPGGFENQSVSGVTTICLTQCNTSPSHRVDQVVDCGLCNVGSLLFNGCVKLLDIGRNWNTLSYTPIQSITNMLNGCFQLPGIVYRSLQHGAVHYHSVT